ncbi:MAG: acyltransferase domain-containing protein [Deltaproteobacteria bacterium]|nr:acyltransferase domain-containing protein [Deltaproteobacteria bacterium]
MPSSGAPSLLWRQPQPIAVVGLGCVFPKAPDVAAFWERLKKGESCLSEVPPDRWDTDIFYDPNPQAPEKSLGKMGGFVSEIPLDPAALRVPPRTAAQLDRLQVMAVAAALEALRRGGYRPFPAMEAPRKAGGTPGEDTWSLELPRERTAVILGAASGRVERDGLYDWRMQSPLFADALRAALLQHGVEKSLAEEAFRQAQAGLTEGLPELTEDSLAGVLPNVAAGRVAGVFGLRGPSFVVDAACASSLAAVDAAVDGLLAGDWDLALAGGANAMMDPRFFVSFSKFQGMSPSCVKPFDQNADGFVLGEGAGFFLLKRLEDALTDGNPIYALVRGVGSASDGRAGGMAAPNPASQALAMSRALAAAGVSPQAVDFVEAHGAGTPVGDPLELQALALAYQLEAGGRPGGALWLGAVKSQLGHLMGGAGAAGMMKAVLALHQGVIPPTRNHHSPIAALARPGAPRVATRPLPWPKPQAGDTTARPRLAGVSSFGFGGSYFHAILEGWPSPAWPARAPRPPTTADRSDPPQRQAPASREPVAVVGLGALLPGAANPQEFWENLTRHHSAMGPLPAERWFNKVELFHQLDPARPDTSYGCIGAVVAETPEIATHIPLAPSARLRTDRAQKLFLHAAQQALDDSAHPQEEHAHPTNHPHHTALVLGNTGGCLEQAWSTALRLNAQRFQAWAARAPLAGLSPADWAVLASQAQAQVLAGHPEINEDTILGYSPSIGPARLAKALDIKGPHVVVDAACGSGLAALDWAARGLRLGKWNRVLAGGFSAGTTPTTFVEFARCRALSSQGEPPLSAWADGVVPGEGAVVFVLKRLADARAAGDRVYACLKGVGGSSDGRGHAMMTPDTASQMLAMERAWHQAGLPPASAGLVECHATGTQAGDAAELLAVERVFSPPEGARNFPPPALGAVKGSIGHTLGAAGAAGVLKAVLAIHHQLLPPLHRLPHPLLQVERLGAEGRFRLPLMAGPWFPVRNPGSEQPPAMPLRAGVSAFGFGGTNWHAVLESAGGSAPLAPADPLRVVFLFPGQGSQYAGMAHLLLEKFPLVRETFEEADEVLLPLLGRTLEQLLLPAPGESSQWVEERLLEGGVLQPVLLAVEVACQRLLEWLGIVPDAMAGHSLGEYAALVAAGAVPFGQALRVTALRGRESWALAARGADAGIMAVVMAPAAQVEPLLAGLKGYVAVANRNSPHQTVLSGETPAVQAAVARLSEEGLEAFPLPIHGAFHSQLAGALRPAMAQGLAGLHPRSPRVPVLSSVDGRYYMPGEDCRERMLENLLDQLEKPVDFIRMVNSLYDDGTRVFIEVGPKKALASFVADTLDTRGKQDLHPLEPHAALSMLHPKGGEEAFFKRFLEGLRQAGLHLREERLPLGWRAGTPQRIHHRST